MSHLSLYRPPTAPEDDEPRVFSFTEFSGRIRSNRMLDVITRARIEKENSQCPCCQRITVRPLELADGVRNRNGAKVPGTATIVAFRCTRCRHEWPVRERA
jgi:hypothetical protein